MSDPNRQSELWRLGQDGENPQVYDYRWCGCLFWWACPQSPSGLVVNRMLADTWRSEPRHPQRREQPWFLWSSEGTGEACSGRSTGTASTLRQAGTERWRRGVYTYPDSAQSGQLTASYTYLLATHMDQNSAQNDSCYFPQSCCTCMVGKCKCVLSNTMSWDLCWGKKHGVPFSLNWLALKVVCGLFRHHMLRPSKGMLLSTCPAFCFCHTLPPEGIF